MSKKSKYQMLPLATLGVVGSFFFLFGCNVLIRKAPPVDQVLFEDANIAYRLNAADIPVDWRELKSRRPMLETQLRGVLDEDLIAVIDELAIDPEKVSGVAASVTGINEWVLDPEPAPDKLPNWIVAVNYRQLIPASAIVERINGDPEIKILAERLGSQKGFDRINLRDRNGKLLAEIGVYSGRTTQLRFGSPVAVQRSIHDPVDPGWMREEMIPPNSQSWFYFDIPESFSRDLEALETMLPFEQGTLVSGLRTAIFSQTFSNDALQGTLALEFDDNEQADTAFSYLHLAMNLAIKPILRRHQDGALRPFVKNLDNRKQGDLVFLHARATKSDLKVLSEMNQSPNVDVLIDLIFDLIKEME